MEDFLKRNLKDGKKIIFYNENKFVQAELGFKNTDKLNTWSNGYSIYFEGRLFMFKTFDGFFKKFNQLKSEYDLQLKSW